jgi:tryptophan halogenase
MKTIGIVGGGTSGLICALILQQRFQENLKIHIIKSNKIGIIGVGESTTEHFMEFIKFVGITPAEIIKHCGATFKNAVKFQGWTEKDYYHSLEGYFYDYKITHYLGGFGYLIGHNYTNQEIVSFDNIKNNTLDTNFQPSQFHLNAELTNKFLLDICKKRGIRIIEDTLTDVQIHKDKSVKWLQGTKRYKFDFYIDVSGLHRLINKKQGGEWESYEKYLKVNHAIAFPTPDTSEYPAYTSAIRMKAGWLWRIPVWGRWGNGYVFNDKFISVQEAQKECEQLLKQKVEIFKDIKFNSGQNKTNWIKNCACIGLSSSFIEPLEATAISQTITQSFILMHLLSNYNEESIQTYNNMVKEINQNILDFVSLSYYIKKGDTPFWKMIKKTSLTNSLKTNLKKWQTRLPSCFDFPFFSSYLLFDAPNFTLKLHALGLLKKNEIKKEFQLLPDDVQIETATNTKRYLASRNSYQKFKHKNLIKLIRNNESIHAGWVY